MVAAIRRLGPINRVGRALNARSAFKSENNKVKAGVKAITKLVNTNYRVNQGINLTKRHLGIPNNRNQNLVNLGASIKRSLKNEDPFRASPEIRNKTIRTMSNYIALRVGFKNRLNTERIYQLIIKITRLKTNMNAAPDNAARREIGKNLGLLLGELVLQFARTRPQGGNGRGRAVGLGFLNGILTKILGPRMANTVNQTIKSTQSWQNWYRAQRSQSGYKIEEVN
jgi:hypothetical protein